MATNKNQHFVPRCYLRPFTFDSDNKAINLFNIDRLKFIELTPVKHQCSGDYFYGKDPLLEDAIQFLETSYSSTLREILNGNYKLTNLHRTILKRFWLLQYLRTESASKRSVESAHDMNNIAGISDSKFSYGIKEAVLLAMKTYSDRMDIVDDLKVCLLKNKTSEPFITSDDPAILTNRWHLNDQRTKHRSFGLHTCGSLFFLPLSPDIMCIGYDGDVYSIPHKNGWADIKNKSDVKALNQHQYMNCWANIYVRDANHAQFVHDSFVEASSSRLEVRHRIHYSVKDYDEGGYTRYKVVDPKQNDDHEDVLIHMETMHAYPTMWPSQIKWRPKGFVNTNGTGLGYIRRGCFKVSNHTDFRKERARK